MQAEPRINFPIGRDGAGSGAEEDHTAPKARSIWFELVCTFLPSSRASPNRCVVLNLIWLSLIWNMHLPAALNDVPRPMGTLACAICPAQVRVSFAPLNLTYVVMPYSVGNQVLM